MKQDNKTLYSFPKLYHHTFSWDLNDEIHFYKNQFSKSSFPVKNILEPACGSGRYFSILEKAGYSVLGYDLMPEMVHFASQLIKNESLKKCDVIQGDMVHFRSQEQFDAAINPVNSFRYLLKDEDILSHLNSTAGLLKSGAFYIIEFAYAFLDMNSIFDQTWTRKLGDSTINAQWQVLEENHTTMESIEKSTIVVLNKGIKQTFETDHITRLWIYEDFISILKQSSGWELEAIYDHDFMQVVSENYFGEMGNLFHILKKK